MELIRYLSDLMFHDVLKYVILKHRLLKYKGNYFSKNLKKLKHTVMPLFTLISLNNSQIHAFNPLCRQISRSQKQSRLTYYTA